MLSPADLDLVGRDRALPGLALVLDGDALAAALRRILPEAAIEGVHVAYLRYKPGTNCLAGCSVRARGGVFDLYAKAYQAGDDKLNAAWSRAAVPGALGPGRVRLKREGTEVFVFPNDKRLAALARLTDNERRPGLLRRLLPALPDLCEATPERLAYKPERRWAGRLQATTGARAVVKVYTPAGFVAARSRAEAVAPRDTLRIPRRLGSSQRHGLLAFQWFDALPLDALLQEAGREAEALERVARALAELHGQKPGRLPQQSREADAAALLRCAREIGMLCPSLAKAVEALAHEIASAIARAALQGNAIHGDLHAGQILLPADDTLVLLDFDRAMRGDPAADLGNLIARWERAVLRGDLARERLRARRGALLDSYSSAAGKWPARVALYTSAALLRSAPDIFRLREPGWDQRIAEVHRRCRELLGKQHLRRPCADLVGRETA